MTYSPQPQNVRPGYPPPGYPPVNRPVFAQPTAPDGRPLAEFSDRLLAYLIDYGVGMVAGLVIAVPAVIGMLAVIANAANSVEVDADGNVTDGDPAALIALLWIYVGIFVLSLLFSYLYFVEWVYRHDGQTVGKRVMKISVVSLTPGTRLNRGHYLKRWFVMWLGTIDGLWQLWDKPYRQCLHDKWPRTVVVKISS